MPVAAGKAEKAPKYLKIARHLRAQIEKGDLKPGDRLPSFVAMRTDFGATPTTVERVYAELERDELIHRKPGQGTFVSAARQRQKTGLVGFVGRSFALRGDPYFSHIVSGIEEVIRREDKRLLLLDSEIERGWDQVDGVLACRQDGLDSLLRYLPAGIPCVTLMVSIDGHSSVVGDDFDGARRATNHLLSLGHRRIAYLTEMPEDQTAESYCPVMRMRTAGYIDALRGAGIAEQWLRQAPLFHEEMSVDYRAWGRTHMQQWLEEDWFEQGCTAILAQNDLAAVGVVAALNEAGVKVPEQVSVVGYDGTRICEWFAPSLTSVEVPLYRIASTGVELLLRHIEDPELEPSKTVLSARVHQRESTAPCRNALQ